MLTVQNAATEHISMNKYRRFLYSLSLSIPVYILFVFENEVEYGGANKTQMKKKKMIAKVTSANNLEVKQQQVTSSNRCKCVAAFDGG